MDSTGQAAAKGAATRMKELESEFFGRDGPPSSAKPPDLMASPSVDQIWTGPPRWGGPGLLPDEYRNEAYTLSPIRRRRHGERSGTATERAPVQWDEEGLYPEGLYPGEGARHRPPKSGPGGAFTDRYAHLSLSSVSPRAIRNPHDPAARIELPPTSDTHHLIHQLQEILPRQKKDGLVKGEGREKWRVKGRKTGDPHLPHRAGSAQDFASSPAPWWQLPGGGSAGSLGPEWSAASLGAAEERTPAGSTGPPTNQPPPSVRESEAFLEFSPPRREPSLRRDPAAVRRDPREDSPPSRLQSASLRDVSYKSSGRDPSRSSASLQSGLGQRDLWPTVEDALPGGQQPLRQVSGSLRGSAPIRLRMPALVASWDPPEPLPGASVPSQEHPWAMDAGHLILPLTGKPAGRLAAVQIESWLKVRVQEAGQRRGEDPGAAAALVALHKDESHTAGWAVLSQDAASPAMSRSRTPGAAFEAGGRVRRMSLENLQPPPPPRPKHSKGEVNGRALQVAVQAMAEGIQQVGLQCADRGQALAAAWNVCCREFDHLRSELHARDARYRSAAKQLTERCTQQQEEIKELKRKVNVMGVETSLLQEELQTEVMRLKDELVTAENHVKRRVRHHRWKTSSLLAKVTNLAKEERAREAAPKQNEVSANDLVSAVEELEAVMDHKMSVVGEKAMAKTVARAAHMARQLQKAEEQLSRVQADKDSVLNILGIEASDQDLDLSNPQEVLSKLSPLEAAKLLDRLSLDKALQAFKALAPEESAKFLEHMDPRARADVLANLSQDQRQEIVNTLSTEELAGLLSGIRHGDGAAVLRLVPLAQLVELLEGKPIKEAAAFLSALEPTQQGAVVAGIAGPAAASLLESVPPSEAGTILLQMPQEQAAACLGGMTVGVAVEALGTLHPENTAGLLQHMAADVQAAMLADLPAPTAHAILAAIEPDQAAALLLQVEGESTMKSWLLGMTPAQQGALLKAMLKATDASVETVALVLTHVDTATAVGGLVTIEVRRQAELLRAMSDFDCARVLDAYEAELVPAVMQELGIPVFAGLCDQMAPKAVALVLAALVHSPDEVADLLAALGKETAKGAVGELDRRQVEAVRGAVGSVNPKLGEALLPAASPHKSGKGKGRFSKLAGRADHSGGKAALVAATMSDVKSGRLSMLNAAQLATHDKRHKDRHKDDSSDLSEASHMDIEINDDDDSDDDDDKGLPGVASRVASRAGSRQPSRRPSITGTATAAEAAAMLGTETPDETPGSSPEKREPTEAEEEEHAAEQNRIRMDAVSKAKKLVRSLMKPGHDSKTAFVPRDVRLQEVLLKHSNAKPRTKDWLIKLIDQLLREKRDKDENMKRQGLQSTTMPEFLFAYLHSQYGTKQLVMEMAGNILATLKKFLQVEPRANTFSRFLSEAWDAHLLQKYMEAHEMLRMPAHMLLLPTPSVDYSESRTSADTWVCMVKCLHTADHILGMRREEVSTAFKQRLEQQAAELDDGDRQRYFDQNRSYPPGNLTKIHRGRFLDMVCHEFQRQELVIKESVPLVFREWDIDKSGSLSLIEVSAMVECFHQVLAEAGQGLVEPAQMEGAVQSDSREMFTIGQSTDAAEGTTPPDEAEGATISVAGFSSAAEQTQLVRAYIIHRYIDPPRDEDTTDADRNDNLYAVMVLRHWRVLGPDIEAISGSAQGVESMVRSYITRLKSEVGGSQVLRLYLQILEQLVKHPFQQLQQQIQTSESGREVVDAAGMEGLLAAIEDAVLSLYRGTHPVPRSQALHMAYRRVGPASVRKILRKAQGELEGSSAELRTWAALTIQTWWRDTLLALEQEAKAPPHTQTLTPEDHARRSAAKTLTFANPPAPEPQPSMWNATASASTQPAPSSGLAGSMLKTGGKKWNPNSGWGKAKQAAGPIPQAAETGSVAETVKNAMMNTVTLSLGKS